MKTQEEIEQLAEKEASFTTDVNFCFGYRDGYIKGYTQCQEDNKPFFTEETWNTMCSRISELKDKKYTESQLRDAIRNTITYLATLSETGKFHSGNIIEESIIQSLNKQD